jgi:hypothetical protein
MDIYVARRASIVTGLGEPVPFVEVNTSGSEFASWISKDGCELWFWRSTTGEDDLHVMRRPL